MPDVNHHIRERLAGRDIDDLDVKDNIDALLCFLLSQIRADELARDGVRSLCYLRNEDTGFVASEEGRQWGLWAVVDVSEVVCL